MPQHRQSVYLIERERAIAETERLMATNNRLDLLRRVASDLRDGVNDILDGYDSIAKDKGAYMMAALTQVHSDAKQAIETLQDLRPASLVDPHVALVHVRLVELVHGITVLAQQDHDSAVLLRNQAQGWIDEYDAQLAHVTAVHHAPRTGNET